MDLNNITGLFLKEEGLKQKNPKRSLSWKNADFFHFGAFSYFANNKK